MHTRADYLAGKCSHDDYYSQFVTPAVLSRVKLYIGEKRIRQSSDPHFNDVPLVLWDHLNLQTAIHVETWRTANEYKGTPGKFPWSLSDSVCIGKRAAKIIKEQVSQ